MKVISASCIVTCAAWLWKCSSAQKVFWLLRVPNIASSLLLCHCAYMCRVLWWLQFYTLEELQLWCLSSVLSFIWIKSFSFLFIDSLHHAFLCMPISRLFLCLSYLTMLLITLCGQMFYLGKKLKLFNIRSHTWTVDCTWYPVVSSWISCISVYGSKCMLSNIKDIKG